MAQIKPLKRNPSRGGSIQSDPTADDVTFVSYTVDGSGAVWDSTKLDLAGTDLDIDSGSDIILDAGTFAAEGLMFIDRENLMDADGAIIFQDAISDIGSEVGDFKLPSLAGAPSATPDTGTAGHALWDSTNDTLYIWNGSMWIDVTSVGTADSVCTALTYGETIAANKLVYMENASGKVKKSDVDSDAEAANVLGFTKAAGILDDVKDICYSGLLGGFSGLSIGGRYFADPTTPGDIVLGAPSGGDDIEVFVGHAVSATQLIVRIVERLELD